MIAERLRARSRSSPAEPADPAAKQYTSEEKRKIEQFQQRFRTPAWEQPAVKKAAEAKKAPVQPASLLHGRDAGEGEVEGEITLSITKHTV
jgi:hypothetical protein